MEVHHHSHKPKNWKEYITEFIMLFAAVTLGFFAENVREHQIVIERKNQEFISNGARFKKRFCTITTKNYRIYQSR